MRTIPLVSASLIALSLAGCGGTDRAAQSETVDEYAAARTAKAVAWPSRSDPYLADPPRSIASVWPQGIPLPPELAAPSDPIAWAVGKTVPTVKGPDPGRPSPWRQIVVADAAEPIMAAWGDHLTGSAAWIQGSPGSYRIVVAPILTGETPLDGAAVRSRVLPINSKPIAMLGATAPDADDPAVLVLLADGTVVEGRGRVVIDGDAWAMIRHDDASGPAVSVQLLGGKATVLRPNALGGWRRDDEAKAVSYPVGADGMRWVSRASVGALALPSGLDYAARAEAGEQPMVLRPSGKPWIIAADYTQKTRRIAIVASEDGQQTDVVAYERSGQSSRVASGDTVPGGTFGILGHTSHLVVATPTGLWAVPFQTSGSVERMKTVVPGGGMAWWASASPTNNYLIVNGDIVRLGGRVGHVVPKHLPERQVAWSVERENGQWIISPVTGADWTITLTKGMPGLHTTWPAGWPDQIVARWAQVPRTGDTASSAKMVIWPRIETLDERAIAQAWPAWDGSLLPGPAPVVDTANDRVVLGDGQIVRVATDGVLVVELAP